MNIYDSNLYKDIHSDLHDCMFCAMTYIKKCGGPSIIDSPDNFENLVLSRKKMLDWLQKQQFIEKIVKDYNEFKETWSPVFLG